MKNYKFRISIITLSVMTAGVVASCNSPSTPAPTQQPGTAPATFSQVQSQVLNPMCVSCHSPPIPSAGLDFTNWDSIVHNPIIPNLVVPGHPEQSVLFLDIQNGQPPGSPEQLTQSQIDLVSSWIQAGAPNN